MSLSSITRKLGSVRRGRDKARLGAEVEADAVVKEFEPPVPRLFRCNDPPTQEERFTIVNRISDIQAEFEALYQQPYTCMPTETSIPPCLKSHFQFLHRHYNLISGIRSMPDEILEMIFYHAFEASRKGYYPESPARHKLLRHLTQTCRRWRGITVSSPRLWSELPSIKLPTCAMETDIERQKKHLKLYIDRSGDHPLTFQFKGSTLSEHDEQLAQIFFVLVAHCKRWESATLELNHALLDRAPHIAGNLPKLRVLNLSLSRMVGDVNEIESFATCPSLRHVNVSYQDYREVGWSGTSLSVTLPWSQLRTFEEHFYFGEGSSSTRKIDSASDTIKCCIDSWHVPFFTTIASRHASITILQVNCNAHDPDVIGSFAAENLILPNLVDLSLQFGFSPLSLTFVLTLVRRSGCSLKRLHVQGALSEPGLLTQILVLSDELEDLKFSVIPTEDLRKLTFDPTQPTCALVPKLRMLEIQCPCVPGNEEISDIIGGPELTEMARSRIDVGKEHRQHVAKLSVKLRFWDVKTCRSAFHHLEESFYTLASESESESDVEVRVKRWEEVLRREIKYWLPRTAALRPSHYRSGRAISDVVKEMEEYPIAGSDLVLLQKYNLPSALDRSAATLSKYIPCNNKYKTHERLQALRDKWRPFVILETALFRRWTFEGTTNLVYLPSDDVQRHGEEAWDVAKGIRNSIFRRRWPDAFSIVSSDASTIW